jgi:GNAT superfamily N-acetyltransferase
MFHVVSSSVAPGHVSRLREWLVAEWGEVDPFKSQSDGRIIVPPPLLGIEGQELLGGLMFSGFRKPGGDALGLWINALFVAPEHRRKRIGSQLIRAAEVEAFRTGERELFALTNLPKLYENLGWQRVERSTKGIVLRAVPAGEQHLPTEGPRDRWGEYERGF